MLRYRSSFFAASYSRRLFFPAFYQTGHPVERAGPTSVATGCGAFALRGGCSLKEAYSSFVILSTVLTRGISRVRANASPRGVAIRRKVEIYLVRIGYALCALLFCRVQYGFRCGTSLPSFAQAARRAKRDRRGVETEGLGVVWYRMQLWLTSPTRDALAFVFPLN